MKIKIYLLLLLIINLALPAQAQKSYTITVNGIKKDIAVKEIQAKIWVDLEALAKELGLETQIDVQKHSLNINYPGSPALNSKLPLKSGNQDLLWGSASLKANESIMPLRNMRIFIFAPNAQQAESLNLAELEAAITKADEAFTVNNGLIKSGCTDLNGYYSFENLPKVNLLLIAKCSYNKEVYLWRLPCSYHGGELRLDLTADNRLLK
jgi:hypothetical protein